MNNCCRRLPRSGFAIPEETRGGSSLHASCIGGGRAALPRLAACCVRLRPLLHPLLRLLLLLRLRRLRLRLGGELRAAVLAWLGACMLGGCAAVHAGPCSIRSPLVLATRLLPELELPPRVAAICLLRQRMQSVSRLWPREPGHAAGGGKCGMLLLAQPPLVLLPPRLLLLLLLLPGGGAAARPGLLDRRPLEA